MRTSRQVIRTYPFRNRNPIPVVHRIYPYFRFDGYTDTPVDKEWTVVELENDHLGNTVFPEIGGEIWNAVEKSTGRSFRYDNRVVNFRDMAMRGPSTSGRPCTPILGLRAGAVASSKASRQTGRQARHRTRITARQQK